MAGFFVAPSRFFFVYLNASKHCLAKYDINMAIKKSQLYSTIFESCNKLRGGMDASQYKDYVLVVLFLKYISDKKKVDPDQLIEIPDGCTFDDIVALKHKDNIGEEINKKLEALGKENPELQSVFQNADFCASDKLGTGKDLVETVSGLIGVFQNSGLDFGSNREADDDLIGDAYEFLMKNFATQSGKSKGQFYTPAEVSRLIAKVVGIDKDERPQVSIYDPTCGSGSLLLRAKAEAKKNVSLNGQESDVSTVGMAQMNMIIHGEQCADIQQGDTINNPKHVENEMLQQFDYVVANPPFSLKSWLKSAGEEDRYKRWGNGIGIGVPPVKCGDYAFLLHIIKSLNHKGKGACILPHGVLFRGNAEAQIRKYIVNQHYIKGIIGLPSNLFFGTGIPACIIVIDKENAPDRKGIFMINANEGYAKDGPKNRLREQDIKRIADVWNEQKEVAHYSHFVTYEEIEKNDFNLNLPRYIEAEDHEVVQDIDAHLHGGVPQHDLDQLSHIWAACPTLQSALFNTLRPGYYQLKPSAEELRNAIDNEPSFKQQYQEFNNAINGWVNETSALLKSQGVGLHPKRLIVEISEPLLSAINASPCLVDGYDAYDQLMNYWSETMQDDCYLISSKGWNVELSFPMTGKGVVKKNYDYNDLDCDLLPINIVIDEYFDKEKSKINELTAERESLEADSATLLEEHEEEFSELDKVTIANVKKVLKSDEAEKNASKKLDAETKKIFEQYVKLDERLAKVKSDLRTTVADLTKLVVEKYKKLTEEEVKRLVVDQKWMQTITSRLQNEMTSVVQSITDSVSTLSQRYAFTLADANAQVNDLESQVMASLEQMGFKI